MPDFLTVEWVLSQFDPDRKRAVREYCRFIRQGRGMNVWDGLRAGALLGTDGFVDRLRPLLKEKPLDPEYCKRERFATRPSLEELFRDVTDKGTRNERIYQAVRTYHYTLREAGDYVGLLYSTISVIAKRVHETTKS